MEKEKTKIPYSNKKEISKTISSTLEENGIETITEEESKENELVLSSISENEDDPDAVEICFGTDFDGTFVDMTGIVEKHVVNLAYQLQQNSSIIDYLQSEKGNIIDDVLRSAGISQALSNIDILKGSYNSLTQSITNFKDFGFSSGSTDVLSGSINFLDNTIELVESFDRLTDYAEDIIDYMEKLPETFDNIEKFVDEKLDYIEESIADITNLDFDKLIENFPEEIADKLMSLDIVQDLFTLPKRIIASLAAISSTIMSIRAPSNLKSVIVILKQLKSIVNMLQDIKSTVEQTAQKIQNLADKIQSGNYLGAILSMAGDLKFIERPSEYDAQYPFNTAYVTEGGHIFETDNTPSKERLHVAHKTGTDIEIQPDGGMVTRVKSDSQQIIDKNLGTHVKGESQLIVDGKSEFYSKGSTILEAGGQCMISAPDIMSISENLTSLLSTDINILSALSSTLHSGLSTSISSTGPVTISSDVSVMIDAPSVILGRERTNLLSLNSNGITSVLSSGPVTINSASLFESKAGIITFN